MRITALKYASSKLPEAMVFRGGSEARAVPIDFAVYLIETEGRKILADAGCVTMPNFAMHDFIGPIEALRSYGISPEEITDVLITHAHHDHIECVGAYPNAVVTLQADEYEKGKRYIPDSARVCLFEDSIAVCKDVEMRRIAGHTKGSCVIHVRDSEREYVIVGDECYTRACIERGIPTGCSYCPEKSAAFIAFYRDPRYTLLYCHDLHALALQ